jgi:hypothetical protein
MSEEVHLYPPLIVTKRVAAFRTGLGGYLQGMADLKIKGV